VKESDALAERDRLRRLLAAYDDHRTAREAENQESDLAREITPDRAAKVRARIASLNEIIGNHGS
jgi:hypothetical protein